MLVEFSVENFLSIRERLSLKLEATSFKEHPENITRKGKENILTTLAIYGANASGKTNLFKAMTHAIITIRNSNNIQITNQLMMVPFKFDEESYKKPSSFEFVFIAKDNKKYIYGFSATPFVIIDEYLYVYNSAKATLIFDRTQTTKYKFARNYKAEFEVIEKRNTSNKLFLSTATSWNSEATKPAFEWFATGIDTYTNIEEMQLTVLEQYRAEVNKEYTSFALDLLRKADINISNINIEFREIPVETAKTNPFGLMFNIGMPTRQIEYKITTYHKLKDSKGKNKDYPLMLNEESLGTQQLFIFAPLLKQAFSQGRTLVIDEIEKSLHPSIVKLIINAFRDKKLNINEGQLIMTTHQTSVLDLDIFRRDQVYFTEKDFNTGVTDLYSLDKHSIRKTENIEKNYLQGRYGAIPFAHSEDVINGR